MLLLDVAASPSPDSSLQRCGALLQPSNLSPQLFVLAALDAAPSLAHSSSPSSWWHLV